MVFLCVALHIHNFREALQDFRLPEDERRGKQIIAKSIVSLKFAKGGEKPNPNPRLYLLLGYLEGAVWGSGAGSSRHGWIPYGEDGFSAAKFPLLHI